MRERRRSLEEENILVLDRKLETSSVQQVRIEMISIDVGREVDVKVGAC